MKMFPTNKTQRHPLINYIFDMLHSKLLIKFELIFFFIFVANKSEYLDYLFIRPEK